MENNASRGLLPGFDGRHRRLRSDRIHPRCIHHHLDVEALFPYPLIIVDKRESDGEERRDKDVMNRRSALM